MLGQGLSETCLSCTTTHTLRTQALCDDAVPPGRHSNDEPGCAWSGTPRQPGQTSQSICREGHLQWGGRHTGERSDAEQFAGRNDGPSGVATSHVTPVSRRHMSHRCLEFACWQAGQGCDHSGTETALPPHQRGERTRLPQAQPALMPTRQAPNRSREVPTHCVCLGADGSSERPPSAMSSPICAEPTHHAFADSGASSRSI